MRYVQCAPPVAIGCIYKTSWNFYTSRSQKQLPIDKNSRTWKCCKTYHIRLNYSLSCQNYGVFQSCRYFTLFRLPFSCSHTVPCSGVLMLFPWNTKPFSGFNRARLGLKWTISNALFNLVNNVSSQYWKRGWTDPCSDLCPSLISLPSTMQLNKLIQLQGNQVQDEQ